MQQDGLHLVGRRVREGDSVGPEPLGGLPERAIARAPGVGVAKKKKNAASIS